MDNLTKRVQPDRSKINMSERFEVRHWTKALGVDHETLQKAVDKVGNSAAAVRKELAVLLKAWGMLAISGARPPRFRPSDRKSAMEQEARDTVYRFNDSPQRGQDGCARRPVGHRLVSSVTRCCEGRSRLKTRRG